MKDTPSNNNTIDVFVKVYFTISKVEAIAKPI